LARFTEESGRYSTASISAVNRYTGANKVKGGPVDRAIDRLKSIRAKNKTLVSNGRSGKAHQMVEQAIDLGPILFDRETWQTQTGAKTLPDGPTERGKVLFVLPDFSEPVADRIWIGGNLVTGIRDFDQPLKAVKNAGDVAARLLLQLYAVHELETWGGARPVGKDTGPWNHYEPVDKDIYIHGGARLIRAKDGGTVGPGGMFSRAWPASSGHSWWEDHKKAGDPVFRALDALKSAGLIYEVVMVLNRDAVKSTFSSGTEYGEIPEDAEPLYELDCRSRHGYKPEGEEGVGGVTANTAGSLGYSVAIEGGNFDGTYAALVPWGNPAMIAGIYRLRFRVANPKNAGIKGAWARIHQNNREAFEFVQKIRAANKLPLLVPPWKTADSSKENPSPSHGADASPTVDNA
jgi:hypothetical protein